MPEVIKRDCTVCGDELEPLMASLGLFTHPGCTVVAGEPRPALGFDDSSARNGFVPLADVAKDLEAEFVTMVRWDTEFAPRSQQVSLGPSDLGIECQRQLGYKIAGVRGYNHGDPLPGFVGSALHARMEDVIRRYAAEHGGTWLIEGRVVVDPLVSGSADLVKDGMVIDIKSGGKDVIDEARKHGPSHKYQVQIQSYAYGLNRSGTKVDRVAIVYFPRAGWLKDVFAWAAPYDPSVAKAALERAYGIAADLRKLDILNNPDSWEQITPTPSFGCQWCSQFNKELGPNDPATDKQCAGWNMKRGK